MASKSIKDYYALLRISPNATQEEIRLAFRQMARTYHPDINNAPDAEAKFREINEAYEILADPEKRKSYDFFAVPSEESPSPQPESPSSGMPASPPARVTACREENRWTAYLSPHVGDSAYRPWRVHHRECRRRRIAVAATQPSYRRCGNRKRQQVNNLHYLPRKFPKTSPSCKKMAHPCKPSARTN